METELSYTSVGGNCHPAAADWDHTRDLVAFGAGINVALWQPHASSAEGIKLLPSAHNATVQAVRFVHHEDGETMLCTGGADRSLVLWQITKPYECDAYEGRLIKRWHDCHSFSINCLASSLEVPGCLVSGAADGILKVWNVDKHRQDVLVCRQIIRTPSSLIPLAIAITRLDDDCILLAVAGTRSNILLFLAARDGDFQHQATLTGHDSWIRSLDFTRDSKTSKGDILLASASQDKYIRLWRAHRGHQARFSASDARSKGEATNQLLVPLLSNKIHRLQAVEDEYIIMFEALLVGHEDWIYTARWSNSSQGLQLLSASADNSLAVWEADTTEGVWYPTHRFGDISAQKGSTTATGSSGGLWNGIWGLNGQAIIALTRSGGWRRWENDGKTGSWRETFGVGGHTKAVRGLSWSTKGSYLLTTSSDQTTRMHAQWLRASGSSWHELSRPQIHGYDLNCVTALDESTFVSGAEEKLLRVFEEPDDIATLLEILGGISAPKRRNLLAANIPVLGLSNKAEDAHLQNIEADSGADVASGLKAPAGMGRNLSVGIDVEQPPLEDFLSKKSLWPEKEKLYGHGFEISAIAVSKNGKIVASSCKASSIDHAVIRLFDTERWQQLLPPLKAHTLSVTNMAFTSDDRFLLSVGRDRQWAVWEQSSSDATFSLRSANVKAHARMILCASWIEITRQRTFVTGGRDKCLKVWQLDNDTDDPRSTFTTTAPVLAVAVIASRSESLSNIALGLETGEIIVLVLDQTSLQVQELHKLSPAFCPSLAVTQLSWRPRQYDGAMRRGNGEVDYLAIASDDHSTRVVKFGCRIEEFNDSAG